MPSINRHLARTILFSVCTCDVTDWWRQHAFSVDRFLHNFHKAPLSNSRRIRECLFYLVKFNASFYHISVLFPRVLFWIGIVHTHVEYNISTFSGAEFFIYSLFPFIVSARPEQGEICFSFVLFPFLYFSFPIDWYNNSARENNTSSDPTATASYFNNLLECQGLD